MLSNQNTLKIKSVDETQSITIQKLLDRQIISVRTYSCMRLAKFTTLYDMLLYYDSGNSFLQFHSVGKKTNEEIENVCNYFLSQLSQTSLFVANNHEINNVSVKSEKLIEKKYYSLLLSYPVRLSNVLRKISALEFIDKFSNCSDFESVFLKTKNVGLKTIPYALHFRDEFLKYVNSMKET